MSQAKVILWGLEIGAVVWDDENQVAVFQYSDQFVELSSGAGIQPSPLHMPVVRNQLYRFSDLNNDTFWKLPGLLAQSLPDKFGNDILDQYFIAQGRNERNFNPIDRLCYIGSRGMGALEFMPDNDFQMDKHIELDEIIKFCRSVINRNSNSLSSFLNSSGNDFKRIVNITTSAGGAKAKALVKFNPDTGSFSTGESVSGDGYEDWLIKFDQPEKNIEYLPTTRIEYSYYLQALNSGLRMSNCRLIEKDGYFHFLTKRFDRNEQHKVFMQSLCNLFHLDFKKIHSYEQSMMLAREYLNMGIDQISDIFRMAVFNVVYRNEDDHTGNMSFLMTKNGQWSVAPAYDLTYSHVPSGGFHQSQHLMSVNSKTQDIKIDDLMACAISGGIKRKTAKNIIDEVLSARHSWPTNADKALLSDSDKHLIENEINRF